MRKLFQVVVPAASVLTVLAMPAQGARVLLSDFLSQCATMPGYCEHISSDYIANAQHSRAICLPKTTATDQAVKDMMIWLRKEADRSKSVSLDSAEWDAVNALWPCGAEDGPNKV